MGCDTLCSGAKGLLYLIEVVRQDINNRLLLKLISGPRQSEGPIKPGIINKRYEVL